MSNFNIVIEAFVRTTYVLLFAFAIEQYFNPSSFREFIILLTIIGRVDTVSPISPHGLNTYLLDSHEASLGAQRFV